MIAFDAIIYQYSIITALWDISFMHCYTADTKT